MDEIVVHVLMTFFLDLPKKIFADGDLILHILQKKSLPYSKTHNGHNYVQQCLSPFWVGNKVDVPITI